MTAEELKNAYKSTLNTSGGSIQPVATGAENIATNSTTPATTGTTTGADRINQMYDSQAEANRLQLESAYNQNMSDAQAAKDKIAPQYQQSANDLAVQFERNRRNMNTQAIGSGINTGAASQMGLSQSNEYLRDFGKLRSEESNAIAEADRNMLNLKTQYQNAVAAAAAENDYKRAAALYDDYNNQTNLDLQKAQLLASYGDFSMYATLYGDEVAANMEAIWKAQNPDLAYNTGKITAQEYKNMTGKYPAGYKKSGGGSGYWGPSSGGYEPTKDEERYKNYIQSHLDDRGDAGAAQKYLDDLVAAGKLGEDGYNYIIGSLT